VKPAPFKYLVPTTVEEALAHLADYGYEAAILAGGQSLIPTMNFRLAQPAVLVDVNQIPGLDTIQQVNGELRIGAMTRQRRAEHNALIRRYAPLLHKALPFVAHVPIRNRGTLGGSIAHADPSAEIPAVMLALNARFRLCNRNGERWVPAESFFVDWFTTLREPEEMLVEIAVPVAEPRSGHAFMELARRHGDYALVGVAAHVTLDEQGCCSQARVALLSVGPGPVLARTAMDLLIDREPTPELIRACAETAAAQDITPRDSLHASAAYKRALVKTLVSKAVSQAFAEANT
jgi:CO/xanthine dehydrogenase FAD-binding subunit